MSRNHKWLLQLLWLGALLLTLLAGLGEAETRYPCAFIDTENITGSYTIDSYTNDSLFAPPNEPANTVYMHKGMEIPRDQVAIYNFVIENGVRVPAERHLRGCVCKLKPCVRFCCPPRHIYDLEQRRCTALAAQQAAEWPAAPNQTQLQVQLANGTLGLINTFAHFRVYIDTPCEHMKAITKGGQQPEYVHWTLHENGTITHGGHLFRKHYCFTPLLLPGSSGESTTSTASSSWDWQPLACEPEKLQFVLGVREGTYAICLLIAIISMFLVLLVYLFCTEMRNTFYGVAIKAYTICIIIGYSLMAHLTLNDPAQLSKAACRLIPSFTLLCLVLSFYILSFISFNLYLNFHGVNLTKIMFWLIFGPIVLIAVGWSFFVGYSYHGSKLIFGGDSCWFDPRNWSVMIYMYAPIFIAFAICIFFYIMTLIHINERRELQLDEGQKRSSCSPLEENRFHSFWRFFGYTSFSWFGCSCSFALNYYRGERSHLNYAVSFFTAFHGFAALYALIGKNKQIQNFLRRIEENV